VEVAVPAEKPEAAVEVEPVVAEAAPVTASIAPVAVVAIEPAPVDVVETPEITITQAAAAEISAVDLEKSLAQSGLVLVQTTAPAVIAQPEPPVKLGRPRKPKALSEQTDEAALVMVETGK
jgi:ribonuclease E